MHYNELMIFFFDIFSNVSMVHELNHPHLTHVHKSKREHTELETQCCVVVTMMKPKWSL